MRVGAAHSQDPVHTEFAIAILLPALQYRLYALVLSSVVYTWCATLSRAAVLMRLTPFAGASSNSLGCRTELDGFDGIA